MASDFVVSMTEHCIWVICATRGEHSDREFWIVCWAMTEADARGLAETLTAEQEKFQASWKLWLAEHGKLQVPRSRREDHITELLQQDYHDRKKLAFLELSAGMLITPSRHDEIKFTVEKVSDVPAQT